MVDICHVQLPRAILSQIIRVMQKIVLVVYLEFSLSGNSRGLASMASLSILIMKQAIFKKSGELCSCIYHTQLLFLVEYNFLL